MRRMSLLVILVLVSFLFVSIAEGLYVSEEIRIGEVSFGDRQVSSSIAVDDEGNKFVIWSEQGIKGWEMVYRHGDGQNWGDVQRIVTESKNDIHPQIAYGNDKLHLVWTYYESTDQDIYYMNYNGTNWSEPFEISNDTVNENQRDPKISVDGEQVHIIWQELIDGKWKIFIRSYKESNWEMEYQLSSSNTPVKKDPSIDSFSGKIFTSWTEIPDWGRIVYRHFNGIEWEQEEIISSNEIEVAKETSMVKANDNTVYFVWSEEKNGDFDILLKTKRNETWNDESVINDVRTGDQKEPIIDISDGNIGIAWTDHSDGDQDIFFKFYSEGEWTNDIEISNDTVDEDQRLPFILLSEFKILFSWSDDLSGDLQIHYREADFYPKPSLQSISIQGESDLNHVIDHSPTICWTYIGGPFPDQIAYNVSIWSNGSSNIKLFVLQNASGNESQWDYIGTELIDGESYNIIIQVFNGHRWSDKTSLSFRMNSHPTPVTDPLIIYLDEDPGDVFIDPMTLFVDEDNQLLHFEVNSSENIAVEILENQTLHITIVEHWFGNENITITSNDTFEQSILRVEFQIHPVPDYPINNNFSYEKDSVNENNISFIANPGFDVDSDFLTYEWDFGDGISGNGITTDHTYEIKNVTCDYIVTLKIFDGSVYSNECKQIIRINATLINESDDDDIIDDDTVVDDDVVDDDDINGEEKGFPFVIVVLIGIVFLLIMIGLIVFFVVKSKSKGEEELTEDEINVCDEPTQNLIPGENEMI